MIIDRIFTPGLAQVAYLVADEAASEVAVIDPRRDVDVYLEWANRHEMRIAAIFETHVHADFVSGARELSLRTDAPVYSGRLGEQTFPHRPLDDGDEVAIGALRLRAFFTPGHTPEHMSYLLLATADAEAPVALFSGDFLFVGDVGRPDLLGKEQTEALSHQLYESVSQRLAPLPDELTVYPGHTAGSACGKKIGDAPHTTLGLERIGNYALRATDRVSFVRDVMENMPKPPTYYPVLKQVNKHSATLLAALTEPKAMTPDDVQAAAADALVIDTRGIDAFGAAHVPGSLFAGYGPNFHTWIGWVAPYDRDVIIVPGGEGDVDDVVTALRQIGIDRVVGYLAGGLKAWTEAGKPTASLSQATVTELASRLDGGEDLTVLDVRSPEEFEEGHIEGARHFYAGDLAQGQEAPAWLNRNMPIAVICGSGYRSSVAASLLMNQGFTNLVNVSGGMNAWNEAKLPTAKAV